MRCQQPRRRVGAALIVSKYARLHELLGLLGNDQITLEVFWPLMNAAGLTNDDIDRYCQQFGGWTPPPGWEGR